MGDVTSYTGHELLSPERAAFLNETQPEFARWVKKGDMVECGIDGDMLKAYKDGEVRPMGEIIKLKRFSEAGVSLRVRLAGSNQVVEIPVGTTDPGRVWQPTQATFELMQHRAMAAGMANLDAEVAPAAGADLDGPAYRGTNHHSVQKFEVALADLQNTLTALSSEVSSMRNPGTVAAAAPLWAEGANPGSDSDSSTVEAPHGNHGTFHFASDMSSDSEDGY
jgi:hypothetical protein